MQQSHPFVDGNGRTARLLMNMVLLMMGYPAAIISKNDRLSYINSLEKAQLGGTKTEPRRLPLKLRSPLIIPPLVKSATSVLAESEFNRNFPASNLSVFGN
jgi:fido (protein-threonine AMPylation protein)